METTVNEKPYIFDETEDFAVVYKPSRMHCAPLKDGEGGTLLEWYTGIFPFAATLKGKKEVEGGLLHRLDFETNGLVLIAKNQATLDAIFYQQAQGQFVKEYTALTFAEYFPHKLAGFPPLPPELNSPLPAFPFSIESCFRAYGPGRKTVRPVIDFGENMPHGKKKEIADDFSKPYKTEVIESKKTEENYRQFTIRIKRGFRHQIRCHLAWIGYPILNDPVYGFEQTNSASLEYLCLCAQGLFFFDPHDGALREYRLQKSFELM
jgi:23S rRNA pseudouridine1911/1915/1917 synthase